MTFDAIEKLNKLENFLQKYSEEYKDSIPNIQNEPLLKSSITFLKKLNPFSQKEIELIDWCFSIENDEDLWKASWTCLNILTTRSNIDTSVGVEDEFREENEDLAQKLGSVDDETKELLTHTLLPILAEAPTDSKKAAIMVHIWVNFHTEMDLPKCT
jgi:hypothetical protein